MRFTIQRFFKPILPNAQCLPFIATSTSASKLVNYSLYKPSSSCNRYPKASNTYPLFGYQTPVCRDKKPGIHYLPVLTVEQLANRIKQPSTNDAEMVKLIKRIICNMDALLLFVRLADLYVWINIADSVDAMVFVDVCLSGTKAESQLFFAHLDRKTNQCLATDNIAYYPFIDYATSIKVKFEMPKNTLNKKLEIEPNRSVSP